KSQRTFTVQHDDSPIESRLIVAIYRIIVGLWGSCVPIRSRVSCLRSRGAGALLLHPPFNIALLTARDRQRSWRNVIFNDGARARIRAVADVDRGDEHGVGTGAHVAADGGVVLIYSVIIYKHGGGTNIGFLTDGGITNVSQVRNLGTATNLGVFSFHESAQLAVLTQLGIGTDEGKRSDLGVGANDRFFAVGANHTCPAPDLHVSQGGIRANHGIIIHAGSSPQLSAGVNGDIAANGDIHTNPGGERVNNIGTIEHGLVHQAAVELTAGRS